MKKVFMMLLICSIISVSIINSAHAKSKKDITLDDKTIEEIRVSLEELDVDYDTQTTLINKLENGEIWDSMNSEKINEISEDLLTPTIDEPVKRIVFDDGSVYEVTMDVEEANIKNSTVSNDDLISTKAVMITYYTDVKISAQNGLSGGGFYADYYIDWNYNDEITDVRDSYINVIAGSYSDKELEIVRYTEKESSEKAAEAKLTADITYAAGIGGSETFHLKMYVGNDKMKYGMLGSVSSVY